MNIINIENKSKIKSINKIDSYFIYAKNNILKLYAKKIMPLSITWRR